MEAWRERLRLFWRSRKKEQLLTALLVAAILLLAFWPTKSREDTDEEEAVFSSYLPILGLQSWDALVRELN